MKEQVVVVGRVWASTTEEENKQQGQQREGTSDSVRKSKKPQKLKDEVSNYGVLIQVVPFPFV